MCNASNDVGSYATNITTLTVLERGGVCVCVPRCVWQCVCDTVGVCVCVCAQHMSCFVFFVHPMLMYIHIANSRFCHSSF